MGRIHVCTVQSMWKTHWDLSQFASKHGGISAVFDVLNHCVTIIS